MDSKPDGKPMANATDEADAILARFTARQAGRPRAQVEYTEEWKDERIRGLNTDPSYEPYVRICFQALMEHRADDMRVPDTRWQELACILSSRASRMGEPRPEHLPLWAREMSV